MNPKIPQCSPQIDGLFPVHFQAIDSSPFDRGDTNDEGKIITPNKIFTPCVGTGIEQGNRQTSQRVKCLNFIGFAAIAELAGVGKVGVFFAAPF